MNSPDSEHLPGSQPQSAGDVTVSGNENAIALVNAAGNAAIDQSRHVIYNYYYREASRSVALEAEALPDDTLPCPYRGLFHFGPDDAEFFFGREVFVTELVQAVETRAFIPVLGASGSGKSSVVLAGLVPRLQQLGYWQFTHFRPGEDPFHALALALVPLYTPDLDATDQIAQARKLATYLRDGEVQVGDVIARIQQQHPNQRVLLIADQFEELYTLCAQEDTRRQFLDCLLASLAAVPANASPLVLVATMRADFLSNALSYRPFADMLQAGDVKLGAMNPEELCKVIEQPAAKLGVTFEAGLAQRILKDVEHEPGNLPLLEFALTELWQRRSGGKLTHEAYEAIGQVEGALARYADQQYARLSESEKEQVRHIFIQLVRPGEGTEDTRRLATKAELGDDRWALVKQLADVRLVVTSKDGTKQETVEVVHEALIRNWGELRRWMTTDRNFRTWQERLRGAIQQWESMNYDEESLLRGAALVEAEEKFQQRQGDLSVAEQDFIQQSIKLHDQLKKAKIARQQREIRRSRRIAVGAISIAIAISAAGIFSFFQWNESQKRNVLLLVQSASAKFLANQQLEAMVEAIKAERQRRQLLFAQETLSAQTVGMLMWISSGIRERNIWEVMDSSFQSMAFSLDGQKIAIGGIDGTVKIWDLVGNLITSVDTEQGIVWSVAFSPDSQKFATGGNDGAIKLWDLLGQTIDSIPTQQGEVYSVAFSSDDRFATGGKDGTVKLWDPNGNFIRSIVTNQEDVNSVAFSPNGQLLVTGGNNGTTKLWNSSGNFITTVSTHQGIIYSVDFSPDGRWIAAGGENSTVVLWDVMEGKPIYIPTEQGAIYSLAFNSKSQFVTRGKDSTIKYWDLEGNLITEISTQQGRINSAALSRDGQWLVTGGSDRTIKLWDAGNYISIIPAQQSVIHSVTFNPDGHQLATAGADGTVKLWDLMGKTISKFDTAQRDVWQVIYSPDGQQLATRGSLDDTVKLWDLEGNLINSISTEQGEVYNVAFSMDSQQIATTGKDGTLKLWDLTGAPITTIDTQQEHVWIVAFNPNGQQIITGGEDGTIRLWDLKGNLTKTISTKQKRVLKAAFSQDGERLVTSGEEKTFELWDAKGNLVRVISTQQNRITGLSFSRDGSQIAISGESGDIELWNPQGKHIATITSQEETVYSLEFSPDGQLLIYGGASDSIYLLQVGDSRSIFIKSCNWLLYYLHNPNIDFRDKERYLCDNNIKRKIN